MKLPVRKDLLRNRLAETCQQMLVNADKRESFYRKLRYFFYFGGDQDGKYATVNKIRPVIETLKSMVYSPDNLKWWLDIPLADRHESLASQMADGAMDMFDKSWEQVGAPLKVDNAIRSALIEGTAIMEWTTRKNKCKLYRIPAAQFGYYREDCSDMEEQEAVVANSYILKSELIRWVNQMGLSGWEEKIEKIANQFSYQADPKTQGLKEIMVTGWEQQGAPIRGYVAPTATDTDYTAQVNVPVVPVKKLWIWDDYYDDYRCFYLIGEDEILWDSADLSVGGNPEKVNPFCRGELPFWDLTPFQIESYVWGWSLVYQLSGVQSWWNTRIEQFDKLFAKCLEPSLRIRSAMEVSKDQVDAFYSPGGFFRLSQPQDSIEPLYPQLPQGAVEGFELIEASLREMANLRPIMVGEGEKGVRSQMQAQAMMRASSSPVRQVALQVEKCITRGGNLFFMYLRENSDERIFTKGGNHAILAQLPEGCEVKIDGHSSSPIFMDDHMQTAITLLKVGAIDQETFVDMVRPPLYGMIKSRLPELQKRQAQSAMMELMYGKGKAKKA